MRPVELVSPAARTVDLDALLDALDAAAGTPLAPFDDRLVDFFARFSSALFREPAAKRYPEVLALAFWMRRAELARLRQEFEALQTRRRLLVPRGLVFHVPPSNVDTMFIYSWLLAALTGNRNLIRVSPRRLPQADVILTVLNALLAEPDWSDLRPTLAVVSYGHDEEVTARVSARCDVRVVWGGDETVAAIRRAPLPPMAKELTFADRSSFAVLDAAAFLALDPVGRRELADRFFNDAFWFEQRACSSPRFVFWLGEAEPAQAASRAFFEELRAAAAARGHRTEASVGMHRFVFACDAILRETVTAMDEFDGAFSVLSLERALAASRDHCGGGLFYQARLDGLEQLEPFVQRKDQTLTSFGVPQDALAGLARRLNGKGVDRIVPIGQALSFDRFWDGYDLLQEFTRSVHVAAAERPLRPPEG